MWLSCNLIDLCSMMKIIEFAVFLEDLDFLNILNYNKIYSPPKYSGNITSRFSSNSEAKKLK